MASKSASQRMVNSWAPLLAAVGRFVDKFGVSFSLILVLFLAVYAMGNAQTKDDFIRELLFAEITGTAYLQGAVGILTLDAVFGVILWRKWLSGESLELKRCAEEKARLQELLAGRALAHTADQIGGGNAGKS